MASRRRVWGWVATTLLVASAQGVIDLEEEFYSDLDGKSCSLSGGLARTRT